MEPDDDSESVFVQRPWGLWRAVAWAMVVFGVIFVLSGLEADVTSTKVTMALGGLAFAVVGVSLATASVRADSSGIRYVNLIRRHIPAEDIESIQVGRGSGAYYDRAAIVVDRVNGKPVRMTALQTANTENGQAKLEETVEDIRAALNR